MSWGWVMKRTKQKNPTDLLKEPSSTPLGWSPSEILAMLNGKDNQTTRCLKGTIWVC